MLFNTILSKSGIKKALRSDKDLSELFWGSATSLIIKISSIGISYLFTLLVLYLYNPSEWGIFSLSLASMMIFAIPGRLGLDTAIVRFTSEYLTESNVNKLQDYYQKSFILVLLSSIACTILMYFFCGFLAESLFKKPVVTQSLKIMSLGIIPMNILFLNAESLRGHKEIKLYSFYKTVASYAFCIPLLYVITKAADIKFNPEISYVIGLWISMVLSIISWNKKLKLNYTLKNQEHSFSEIIKVAFPMLLTTSLIFLLGWTGSFAIGIFRQDPSEVGIYQVALRLSALTSLPVLAINSIAAPKFASLNSLKDTEGLEKVIRQSTKMTFWVSLPILSIFIAFPEFILSLFGKEFKSAALALIFISIGQFISSICGSVGNLLQMTGHQNKMQTIILIGTAVNIYLNYLLIPKYGIAGAGFASMIGVAVWNLSAVYVIWKEMNITTIYIPNIKKIGKRIKNFI
ncbi:MAG: flippase [Sporocytophaga sp.]|uniref:flippase n=1 Tax=Sporocytophaga sp. TaxID=2231183 RepID=UPI001B2C3F66|nr:flippase [Sporocytophaga sp.]MBO9699275.1 flippase [Sporocytophaga sp.]